MGAVCRAPADKFATRVQPSRQFLAREECPAHSEHVHKVWGSGRTGAIAFPKTKAEPRKIDVSSHQLEQDDYWSGGDIASRSAPVAGDTSPRKEGIATSSDVDVLTGYEMYNLFQTGMETWPCRWSTAVHFPAAGLSLCLE